jgi:anti-sigma B factor antagonist
LRVQPGWPKGKESKVKLSLEVCTHEGVSVVYCRGRVTYRDEAVALSDKVGELLHPSGYLVLELRGVEMIDAAGLGKLVVILIGARARQCSIKLAAPSRHIRNVLELTNLDSVFEIYPTLNDAALACREQAA